MKKQPQVSDLILLVAIACSLNLSHDRKCFNKYKNSDFVLRQNIIFTIIYYIALYIQFPHIFS